jgi:hypothetical protein
MVAHPFEELQVQSVLFVVEDQFFVQSEGRVEFLLEIQVAGFGQHFRNIIVIIMGKNLAFRLYYIRQCQYRHGCIV